MNKVDRMYAEIDVLQKEYDKYDNEVADLLRGIWDDSKLKPVDRDKLNELRKQRQDVQDKISGLEYDIEELLADLQ